MTGGFAATLLITILLIAAMVSPFIPSAYEDDSGFGQGLVGCGVIIWAALFIWFIVYWFVEIIIFGSIALLFLRTGMFLIEWVKELPKTMSKNDKELMEGILLLLLIALMVAILVKAAPFLLDWAAFLRS